MPIWSMAGLSLHASLTAGCSCGAAYATTSSGWPAASSHLSSHRPAAATRSRRRPTSSRDHSGEVRRKEVRRHAPWSRVTPLARLNAYDRCVPHSRLLHVEEHRSAGRGMEPLDGVPQPGGRRGHRNVQLDGRMTFWADGAFQGRSMLDCLARAGTNGSALPDARYATRP